MSLETTVGDFEIRGKGIVIDQIGNVGSSGTVTDQTSCRVTVEDRVRVKYELVVNPARREVSSLELERGEGKRNKSYQMLNPPFARPGVFNQMSCLKSVHSPVLNVQLPRPIDIP